MNVLCVVWDRENNRMTAMHPADVKNVNLAALMDDKPGVLVVRDHCSAQDADRFIEGYAGVLERHAARRKRGTRKRLEAVKP